MADLKDLASLDATAQAALVQTREVSPLELVTAAVERAEAVNGDLNAIIHPRYEQAIEEAKGALADGPFSGVPFVLKDLDGIAAGEPLHAGTRFLKDHKYVAPTDSWLTARFRRAGLVCIGRTNTPELGLLPSTEPLTYGPTHNPWDLTAHAVRLQRRLGRRGGRGHRPPRPRRRRRRVDPPPGQRLRAGRPQAVARPHHARPRGGRDLGWARGPARREPHRP